MKFVLFLTALAVSIPTYSIYADESTQVITIPYMDIAADHRDFADVVLNLALELSEDAFGPYKIIQHRQHTVMLRQLQELEKGENLSVAVSMPMPESLEKALLIQFPVLKGLSSYRMFLVHEKNQALVNNIDSLGALKALKMGQGPGWSTAKILQDNGFQVVYGGPYTTLIPMLQADRFQLFMRAAYEILPELDTHKFDMPELRIADDIAAYTYLPMYFFVSKRHPQLAARLDYGLKKAHASGQYDQLFMQYFSETLQLINAKQRKVFYLENTNIDDSFYELDKPYLLDDIKKWEAGRDHFGVSPSL